MTTKVQNYTPEQTAKIVADYEQGFTVEQIATELGKSARSIVAKLSREGVYRSKAKTSVAPRVKKADLVDQIATALQVAPEVVDSLEKATHEALELLAHRLSQ